MEMDDDMDTKRLEAYGRATDHQKKHEKQKNQKKMLSLNALKLVGNVIGRNSTLTVVMDYKCTFLGNPIIFS